MFMYVGRVVCVCVCMFVCVCVLCACMWGVCVCMFVCVCVLYVCMWFACVENNDPDRSVHIFYLKFGLTWLLGHLGLLGQWPKGQLGSYFYILM
jgi:hypothetical protein